MVNDEMFLFFLYPCHYDPSLCLSTFNTYCISGMSFRLCLTLHLISPYLCFDISCRFQIVLCHPCTLLHWLHLHTLYFFSVHTPSFPSTASSEALHGDRICEISWVSDKKFLQFLCLLQAKNGLKDKERLWVGGK